MKTLSASPSYPHPSPISPPMKIKLHDNEALRAIVAAAKVRMILRGGK